MNTPLPDPLAWVAGLVAAHRDGQPIALLFDYDGTLTPTVAHPNQARLPESTRALLAALSELPDVAVGVLSGRSLADVSGLVGLPRLFYAGSGGLEIDLYGERLTWPGSGAFRAALSGLLGPLVRIVSGYPGAWIERKTAALALHFRALPPLRALAFQREVFALLRGWPSVRHQTVTRAIELTPAAGWDKGTAVAAMLKRLGEGVVPVYVGDAANDTEAMAVVCCLGGVAVGVGPEAPSLATHHLGGPAELAAALSCLLACFSQIRREPIPAQAPGEAIERPSTEVNEPPGAGPGILVVDADPEVRSRTASELRAEGWRVWEAGAVEEAVGTLTRMNGQIKAAIVDLQMPGLQGWHALRELGTRSPSLIRCATSEAVNSQAADAFRHGSDMPLFVRPFRVEMVSAELLRLLGDRRAEQDA